MTDVQAATEKEVVIAAGIAAEVADEPGMPIGVMVFAVVAFGSEAIWLGLIGWWLLNLF
jgi:hypothetical protein